MQTTCYAGGCDYSLAYAYRCYRVLKIQKQSGMVAKLNIFDNVNKIIVDRCTKSTKIILVLFIQLAPASGDRRRRIASKLGSKLVAILFFIYLDGRKLH